MGEEVSQTAICGSIQAIVFSPGSTPDPHPLLLLLLQNDLSAVQGSVRAGRGRKDGESLTVTSYFFFFFSSAEQF